MTSVLPIGNSLVVKESTKVTLPSFLGKAVSFISAHKTPIYLGFTLVFVARVIRLIAQRWVKSAENAYLNALKTCKDLDVTPTTLEESQRSAQERRLRDIQEFEQKVVLEQEYRRGLGEKEELSTSSLNQSFLFIKLDKEEPFKESETVQARRERLYDKFEQNMEKAHIHYKKNNIAIPKIQKKSILINVSELKLKALSGHLTYLKTNEVIVSKNTDLETAQAVANQVLAQNEYEYKRMIKLYNFCHWQPWNEHILPQISWQ